MQQPWARREEPLGGKNTAALKITDEALVEQDHEHDLEWELEEDCALAENVTRTRG